MLIEKRDTVYDMYDLNVKSDGWGEGGRLLSLNSEYLVLVHCTCPWYHASLLPGTRVLVVHTSHHCIILQYIVQVPGTWYSIHFALHFLHMHMHSS